MNDRSEKFVALMAFSESLIPFFFDRINIEIEEEVKFVGYANYVPRVAY